MEALWSDARYALRTLAKSPGFTLAALLTLALGIGANSAMFTLVNAVLLRPLPYEDPDRLVYLWGQRDETRMSATAPDYLDFRARAASFADLGARTGVTMVLTGTGEPERLRAARVSASFQRVLGLRVTAGRGFVEEDDRAGAAAVALLTDGFWRRRFGGDPDAVGRDIVLNGIRHSIVGVLEPNVRVRDDVWVPLALTASEIEATGSRRYGLIGRLRPGVTPQAAEAEARAIAAQLARARPQSNTDVTAVVVPLRENIVGDNQTRLLILLGAAGFVLLIACSNVANLALARASARQRELAVRAALGAGRARLVRQLLTESVLLGLAGGVLGLLLAFAGMDGLVALLPPDTPRLAEVSMDVRVLSFTAVLSLVVGLAFGLVPALRTAFRLGDAWREGARSTASRARHRLRGALVATEVAVSVVLLVASGLLLRSFALMAAVDPGFATSNVLSVRLALSGDRYAEPAQVADFYARALDRLDGLPSVRAAAAVLNVPGSGSGFTISVTPEGREYADPTDVPSALYQAVSPGYFSMLDIPIVRGRGLRADDRAGRTRVAVISREMARRLWSEEEAVGKRFTIDDNDPQPLEVVGVVGDVRHGGPREDVAAEFFTPFAQSNALFWEWTESSMSLLVRTTGEAESTLADVRSAIWSLDADLPVFDVNTLDDVVADSVSTPRVLSLLMGAFALLALVLACIGIYGVMSFVVGQRLSEIGVRLALGAQPRAVHRLVLRQGLRLAGLGLLCGVPAALALGRVLRGSLYGVEPGDPLTVLAVVLVLATTASAACWIPARRATRVDPLRALRSE